MNRENGITSNTQPDDQTDYKLQQLSRQAGRALASSGATLATAESCTGGWLAKTITDVAGSSGWFAFGFVTYSNQAKQQILGVTTQALQQYGAVSDVVVKQMAQGALQLANASEAIAISGIAGPDGGSKEKPVGSVWFGFASTSGQPQAYYQCFAGDRETVRRQAVHFALQQLCLRLKSASQ